MNAEKKISRSALLKAGGRAGLLLTVPGLLEGCRVGVDREADDRNPLPVLAERRTPIERILLAGIGAPNPHNTQPWKFLLRGKYEADLYIDATRLLPATDPPVRQIHIGQGTFLEHASIAASNSGLRAAIELFPEGETKPGYPDEKPVARIRLSTAPGIVADPLFPAIAKRATNRTDYHGPLVSAREFAAIERLIGKSHAHLRFMNGPEEMAPFLDLFDRAYVREAETRYAYDESRIWWRYNEEERRRLRDGISLRGSGWSGLALYLVETFFLKRGEKAWHSQANRDAGINAFRKAVRSSRGLIFLQTDSSTPRDWIQCGRDYARLHLAVTATGLVMQPMSQILQEYPEMSDLNRRFRTLAGMRGKRKTQMIVRLGRSDYRYFSPRRALDDMILKRSAGSSRKRLSAMAGALILSGAVLAQPGGSLEAQQIYRPRFLVENEPIPPVLSLRGALSEPIAFRPQNDTRSPAEITREKSAPGRILRDRIASDYDLSVARTPENALAARELLKPYPPTSRLVNVEAEFYAIPLILRKDLLVLAGPGYMRDGFQKQSSPALPEVGEGGYGILFGTGDIGAKGYWLTYQSYGYFSSELRRAGAESGKYYQFTTLGYRANANLSMQAGFAYNSNFGRERWFPMLGIAYSRGAFVANLMLPARASLRYIPNGSLHLVLEGRFHAASYRIASRDVRVHDVDGSRQPVVLGMAERYPNLKTENDVFDPVRPIDWFVRQELREQLREPEYMELGRPELSLNAEYRIAPWTWLTAGLVYLGPTSVFRFGKNYVREYGRLNEAACITFGVIVRPEG